MNSAVRSPDRSAAAAASSTDGSGGAPSTGPVPVPVTTGATCPPSDHETSAGRMRVATEPGGPYAATRASTASRPRSAVDSEVWTWVDTLRATVAMSDWSWAS